MRKGKNIKQIGDYKFRQKKWKSGCKIASQKDLIGYKKEEEGRGNTESI